MPDNELQRLRNLRRRAETLLGTLVSDLRPFRHTNEENGYVRKPDSESIDGDINVTTTCSCLMALAFADKLGDMYPDGSKEVPNKIFENLVDAPWMSSGLAEHNPFTTTLVLRTFGFVSESGLKNLRSPSEIRCKWESHFQFQEKKIQNLAGKLKGGEDALSKLLFSLLSISAQASISKLLEGSGDPKKVESQLSAELERIIGSTNLYEESRFSKVNLSEESKAFLGKQLDGYNIARFNRRLIHDYYHDLLEPSAELSLEQIAVAMSDDICRFKINNYPPAAAVVFWFIDGVSRAQIQLPPDNWTKLCKWAAEEFAHQRSLVVAEHAAMMDPVAMGMAACACSRLRFISNRASLGTNSGHLASLPSVVELEQAVRELFAKQTMSGIWEKYFPLFHYQGAGSNFCFTFETLEAVLAEFGGSRNHLIDEDLFIVGLERAVKWCEENRLRCSGENNDSTVSFKGWNSGGFLDTLKKGHPESWATAVVHMFLRELSEVLSRRIQKKLLQKYEASSPKKKVESLLDIDLWLDGGHKSLKSMLAQTIVKAFEGKTDRSLRKRPQKKVPLSALLFGPPGTSKTEVTRAIAAELGWPLLEIDPSHFLKSSLQDIYVQAETIFEDVMDLSGVVVLFDEMDALVQKRDAEGVVVDTESKFLTTYMLPKLAKLHDRGRVVFFMATNFQANFDDAIKRAGRFDFLLCMGPPTLSEKCAKIHVFFGEDEATKSTQFAAKKIWDLCRENSELQQQLELYTFGEFKSFVAGLADEADIDTFFNDLTVEDLAELVKEDSKSAGLKLGDLEKLMASQKCKRFYELDEDEFSRADLESKGLNLDRPAVKYILDRKHSRRQCARFKGEVAADQTAHYPPTILTPPKKRR